MIKDPKSEILYRSVYLLLTFFALLSGGGVFGNPSSAPGGFWDYYTNQSNVICLIAIAAGLFLSVKSLKGPLPERWETLFARGEYLVCVWILITCLVYNFMLAPTEENLRYFGSFENPMLHLFGPLLFIGDFFLFAKRRALKGYDIALTLTYPYLYVAFAWIRGAIVKENPALSRMVYPYFFLDVDRIGWGMSIGWVAILTLAFLALGSLLFFLNRRPLSAEQKSA